jgi:hypothetical protein
MRPLSLAFLLASVLPTTAQDNIVHFSVWNPRPGQASVFEDGYHHHLQWHAANKDTWSWFGWYIISGPRHGQFIDATFGHSWADFDHPVNPTGDGADNALHTEPFADYLKAYKAMRLPFSDTEDTVVLTSKFVRMLTIEVTDRAGAAQLIKRLLTDSRQKDLVDKVLVYEVVDGGEVGQVVMLLGGSSFQDLGKTAGLPGDLQDLDGNSGGRAIGTITAETLVFRRDMSRIPLRPSL